MILLGGSGCTGWIDSAREVSALKNQRLIHEIVIGVWDSIPYSIVSIPFFMVEILRRRSLLVARSTVFGKGISLIRNNLMYQDAFDYITKK